VGSDIALANAVAHVILDRGLENHDFIAGATAGFDAYAITSRAITLERARRFTGVARPR
jgi:anaerobic selenocysteine-containing dehydrogenase